MNLGEAEAILLKQPRVDIGFYPTPVQFLGNLSKRYGVRLYAKRDDLSGPEFGGNKIRKLEFLLAEALGKKCEYVFTYGAHQTNHGRETVAACRRFGLKPVLYLTYLGEGDRPREAKGNVVLDELMGAEIHYVSPSGSMSAYETVQASYADGAWHIARLEADGHRCYNVPLGGFSVRGSLGFALGFVELLKQWKGPAAAPDYIFHATGSGGTLAGLLAGKRLLDSETRIVSVSVDQEPAGKRESIVDMANEVLRLLGSGKRVSVDDVSIDMGYIGGGYEVPSVESTRALKECAREEGLLLDPVYTAKGMAGLLDYAAKGMIPQGSTVLFWHTGGTPALFAEKEITGLC